MSALFENYGKRRVAIVEGKGTEEELRNIEGGIYKTLLDLQNKSMACEVVFQHRRVMTLHH